MCPTDVGTQFVKTVKIMEYLQNKNAGVTGKTKTTRFMPLGY